MDVKEMQHFEMKQPTLTGYSNGLPPDIKHPVQLDPNTPWPGVKYRCNDNNYNLYCRQFNHF